MSNTASYQRKLIVSRFSKFALEWFLIILIAFFYSGDLRLNFDRTRLQQTGEHNEGSTLPLLAEIGLRRYGEIPLWNPYMLIGYPHTGDMLGHFWNRFSTIPIVLFGGIIYWDWTPAALTYEVPMINFLLQPASSHPG